MKYNFPTYSDMSYNPNEPVLSLYFGRVNQSKYGQVLVRPAYVRSYQSGQLGIEYYGDHTGEHVLHWLTFSAQFDWNEKKENDYRDYYAEKFGYQDEGSFSMMDIDRTEEKLKFLKRLRRGLDKIENVRGRAQDFPEQVQRLAEVMSISLFALDTSIGYAFPRDFRYIEASNIVRILREAVVTNRVGY